MILVTGGAGYIGSVLVRQLLERGETVRVYDKLIFGDSGLRDVMNKIEIVQGDLRDFDKRILDGVTAIIHLAGMSNDPTAEYNPKANWEMNTLATAQLARIAKNYKIKRFTFGSSCSIYDQGVFSEDLVLSEDSPVSPRAAYALSKYEAEKVLLELSDDNFRPVIFRQGTVYGFSPRMRYDLVLNTFIKDAITKGVITINAGGEMWRPLVDVYDVGLAHIRAISVPSEKIKQQIFNLSYKNYRILELAHIVKDALKDKINFEINVDYSNYNTRSYRVSTERTQFSLGFHPTVAAKDSALNVYEKIYQNKMTDFENPIYYNIKWMTQLDEMEQLLSKIGSVFGLGKKNINNKKNQNLSHEKQAKTDLTKGTDFRW